MIPKRMNLVTCEIKLLARAGRVPTKNKPYIDKAYRRPRGRKMHQGPAGASILQIKAQVVYDRQEDKSVTALGDSPETSARLVMRKTTFDSLAVKPEKGDLIVKVAGESVEYEITQVLRRGHLRGRANLMFMYFERPREKVGSP